MNTDTAIWYDCLVWFDFFYQNIGYILSTIDQIQRTPWNQDEHIKWITEERASWVPSEQIYLDIKAESYENPCSWVTNDNTT